jgi:putative ABC transport system ATP-binding protein
MSLIQATGLCKNYQSGDITVTAIEEATFAIEEGAFVCFVGPSGSGKSTLLNMIGCLDTPTCGSLEVLDTDVGALDRHAAARFRGNNIGFVFQDFNLIPVLSVYENIEYPLLMVQNRPSAQRRKLVTEVIEAVGMQGQEHKRPDHLSGGQKQRVAIARALVTQSKLVLADEPTANLDSATAYRVIDLMGNMRDKFGTTFIFSTHDPKVMQKAEQTFTLSDGHLSSSGGATHA